MRELQTLKQHEKKKKRKNNAIVIFRVLKAEESGRLEN